MIIGIDGNEANVYQRVGVSVYTLNLLYYFQKEADSNKQFKVFLKNPPLADLPKQTKYFQYQIIKGRFLWSQIFIPWRLYRKRDIDIFFSPAHYAPRFLPVPYVVTIHDLSYLYYPEDFLKKDLYQLKHWTAYSIKKAKKIIAVSYSTKKDILKNYPVAEDKIVVIYNGFEKPKIKTEKLKFKTMKEQYILYVGTIQPRKNLSSLIAAFEKLIKFYPSFELIIAGKKGWLYEKIFQQVEETGLTDKIHFTDYITDAQLAFLYQNAFCLVMPSFYEGFGIPILEAFNYGCPVISSSTSSLPEIGKDACLYFDPQNTDELIEKLKLLHADENLRKKLIKKGKERIKLFSWQKCANETLQLLTSVFNDKNNH